ncbi:MAG: OpgC domain-containing protein, partial [Bosea sp. (in: a-proteobacteria)]
FFNPLAWQLLFFTGFSFGMGWLRMPPLRHRLLMPLAIAFVAISVPLNFWALLGAFPELQAFHDALMPNPAPTDLHVLRYVHFLALAYLALCLIEPYREQLPQLRMLAPVIRIGQQTLAVFLCSVPLSWGLGMAMDVLGRDGLIVVALNLLGFAIAIAIATVAAWFKSAPWQAKRATLLAAEAAQLVATQRSQPAERVTVPPAGLPV